MPHPSSKVSVPLERIHLHSPNISFLVALLLAAAEGENERKKKERGRWCKRDRSKEVRPFFSLSSLPPWQSIVLLRSTTRALSDWNPFPVYANRARQGDPDWNRGRTKGPYGIPVALKPTALPNARMPDVPVTFADRQTSDLRAFPDRFPRFLCYGDASLFDYFYLLSDRLVLPFYIHIPPLILPISPCSVKLIFNVSNVHKFYSYYRSRLSGVSWVR